MKVEGVCPNNGCRTVIHQEGGVRFRHHLITQKDDAVCFACGSDLIVTKEVPNEHRFPLGHVLTTVLAAEALARNGHNPQTYLRRHARGDWGTLDAQAWGDNERAMNSLPPMRGRLLSKYRIGSGMIYIITEAGRHETTVITPSEY